MSYFESNKIKQIVALSGIAVLVVFLLVSLSGFIPAFLGAVIFYVICSPLVHFLTTHWKLKKGLAVTITLILSLLIILIPVFSLTNVLVSKITLMLDSYDLYAEFQNFNAIVNEKYGLNIFSHETWASIESKVANFIPNIFEQTLSILADIAIMYFILFFMLYSGTLAESSITNLLPYTKENSQLFAKELVSQTYSNVIGAPLLALIQSCFAIIGFWICGLSEPIFWGLMCGFLSFIPLVGSALIWVPAGLIQLANGASWQGVVILIYGAVVIINVDNVFRFVLQKKIGDVHPLVTVFGVIVGLEWFGIPGLIFGPLLISYLLIMIKVYRAEYGSKNYIISEPVAETLEKPNE
ncbi:MAG: AI-2E family transporter [Bacteroidia bacterium]|jgi:predicted PurR-regulated permease PerM